MAAGESRPAAVVNRPAPVVRREPARAVAPTSQAGSSADNANRDQPNGDSLDEENDQRGPDVEDGPVHRQLIRATLPRIEGHKEERRPTDFTIRQPGGRGNNVGNQFRGGGGGGNDRMRSGGRAPGGSPGQGGNQGHRGNGHRPHGGPRFAGARSGQGQGHGQGQGRGQGGGFRSNQQQPRQGGGRKRSR